MNRFLRTPAALLLLFSIASCKGRPYRIEVDPEIVKFFEEGEELPLHVKVFNRHGKEIPSAKVSLVSRDEGVVELIGGSRVKAAGEGSSTLLISSGNVQKEVSVKADFVESITFIDESITLRTGGEGVKIEPSARNREGYRIKGVPFRFTVMDERVARIDQEGRLTPAEPGETALSVKGGKALLEIPIHVTDPPGIYILRLDNLEIHKSAALLDEDGSPPDPWIALFRNGELIFDTFEKKGRDFWYLAYEGVSFSMEWNPGDEIEVVLYDEDFRRRDELGRTKLPASGAFPVRGDVAVDDDRGKAVALVKLSLVKEPSL